ncbi:hypothetical protein [Halomonas sp. M20]|uniref:hypothetical protein n=1 Tax=Halomonas sp. M20 TaxID=2763264 RepID=UPI001D0B8DDE|nr:hypothetical protein [Halomonas sp. M20]
MATDKPEDEKTNIPEPGDEAEPGTPGTGEDVCPTCGGTGKINDEECVDCGGSGYIIKGIGGA